MEFRGPWADVEIPDATLHELIFEGLTADDAQRLAFIHAENGTQVTFGELSAQIDSIATWLACRGVGRGGVVGIAMANRPEYAAAFHGILRAGAAVTPVNVAAHALEIGRQLTLTGASAVFTTADLVETVAQAATAAGLSVDALAIVDGDAGPHRAWADVLSTHADPPVVHIDPAHDVACMPMSSGTSGLPKAVLLSHTNLVANMLQWKQALPGFGRGDSLVAFLPYSHIYALTTNLNSGLHQRITQLTMSGFQAHLFLDIVGRLRPSMVFVVPPVAAFLAKNRAVGTTDWSSVKVIVSGAASLDQLVGDAVEERLDTRLVQGYGMTELSPVSHLTPLDRPDVGTGTIGLPLPNVSMRVVDPATGRDVPAPTDGWSQPGELWVKGPNTMLGYLGNEQATTETIVDGWVRTGDLVQVDAEGVTRVVDRIKELIKRRGFQVAPVELEALLVTHPLVDDAAVLGVEHRDGDQVPFALVVLAAQATEADATDGRGPDEVAREVVAWFNAQVSQYKHLGGATVVAAIPRSSAGKILRRELPGLLVRPRGRWGSPGLLWGKGIGRVSRDDAFGGAGIFSILKDS